MIILRYFALLFVSIALCSCQKDFTVTSEKRESYAVYCLLNLKDSAQFVRINRIFLSSDDPSQYLLDPDSVNIHPEDFEVVLQSYLDEVAQESILFYPTDEYAKEDGLFSGEGYRVFKMTEYLLPDRVYSLTVRNMKTGYEMTAQAVLLGRRTIENTFRETRYYDINQYSPELIDYPGDLTTTQWDKVIYRFLYYEYTGNDTRMNYVDWRP